MSTFRFKQFSIKQDRAAMKVGTDSILFGSWLSLSYKHKSILDVGAGTGLLSLMMAQKSPSSSITAIEIDEDAFAQADENINNSLWRDRISTVHVDAKIWNSKAKFDLIISNPPYFSDSLLSNSNSRDLARHQQAFNLVDFVDLWFRLGDETSELACILPIDESDKLIELVQIRGSYLKEYTSVRPKEHSKPNRALMLFAKEKAPTLRSELCIRNEVGSYSDAFIHLTKEFYLGL